MRTIIVTIIAILLACFIVACEGDQGPAGPQGAIGPTGPEGPAGDDGTVTVIYITGLVSNSLYGTWDNEFYVNIYNNLIQEDAITQVYLSLDKDVYAWWSMDAWQLTSGAVYIYDPNKVFLGWDYMIKIIPTNE